MNRIKDRLEHLHDWGIESSSGRFWMDETDVDCEAGVPESSPPQPPVLQPDWQRALTQAAASLMQTVKDRLRHEQRLEALREQVRLLEQKVAAQSPRAFIIAPLNSLAPEP